MRPKHEAVDAEFSSFTITDERSTDLDTAAPRGSHGAARLLEHPARILLLDEPTASLDADSEARVWQVLADSVQPQDILVVATHRPMQALKLANRVLVVRGGEVVGNWRRYDTALLLFLLRQRRGHRWAANGPHFAALRPGHPVYERLRAEWDAQEAEDAQAVYDSIDAMIDQMRANSIANAAQLADAPDAADGLTG